jgi:2-dehydropantoate 2-reductase
MNVVIVGAGAIGTLYAVRVGAHHPVTMLTRSGESGTVEVRLVGLAQEVANVRTASKLDEFGNDTIVLLTTKAYDSARAAGGVVGLLRPDTTVVCLQNGLRVEDEVRDAVDDRCNVLRAITYFGGLLESPGVVSLRAQGHTSVESGPGSEDVASLFSSCGLGGRITGDIQKEVWQKTVANAVINPITAITGMEVGWIADQRLDRLKRAIVAECLAVATQEGVCFDEDLTTTINETFRSSRNLSSMHQDLMKGRRTEIDYLNGAIVRLAKKYSIECPINAALTTMIKALEAATRP